LYHMTLQVARSGATDAVGLTSRPTPRKQAARLTNLVDCRQSHLLQGRELCM
jgi:hypothetical protein